jgi:pyruvate/2-oxoglutarate dehydrogenase complex dihydrolipoamide dehydrogenase (E3) component/DNA-directed RNA polymerase subunit RPC12/RpoP
MIEHHREGSYRNSSSSKDLALIEGEARFLSPKEVQVSGRTLRADRIFIATGMRPLIPPIEGLDKVAYLTSENLMELQTLPDHLIVIGGGYVACELGQTYRRYGAKVTIIQRREHLCPREEPDVSTLLERAFAAEGIELLLGDQPLRVEPTAEGVRLIAASKEGERRSIEGSHLLVAAGRRPNTDTLGLDAAGIETDPKGFIKVDDFLETHVSGIWAVGDVNGEQPFTRVCQEEGKVAYANAFQEARIRMQRAFLGHAIFTDPEIGSVGLTEREARAAGHDVAAGLVTFDKVEKAELIGETTGLIKYVADRKTHRLLGCHVIGPDAANLIYDAILVMRHDGTLDEIAKSVGIFPTLQEGMEGTARGLLRKIAPHEVEGPLIGPFSWHWRGGEWQMAQYRCEACGTEFATQEALNTHARQAHGAGAQLTCPACGAEFETQERLNDHKREVHKAA